MRAALVIACGWAAPAFAGSTTANDAAGRDLIMTADLLCSVTITVAPAPLGNLLGSTAFTNGGASDRLDFGAFDIGAALPLVPVDVGNGGDMVRDADGSVNVYGDLQITTSGSGCLVTGLTVQNDGVTGPTGHGVTARRAGLLTAWSTGASTPITPTPTTIPILPLLPTAVSVGFNFPSDAEQAHYETTLTFTASSGL